jgi:hypothetical protein
MAFCEVKMLQQITDDGYLHWRCIVLDPLDGELISCGEMKSCHIDEAIYREDTKAKKPGSGAMIDLPVCDCGARMSLKADYTIRELWHETVVFTDEQHVPQVYALPLQYVRNLRVHWMLYERGRAAYAPVLPMPLPEVLTHPHFAQIKHPDGIYALWFGFAAAQQHTHAIRGSDLPMLLAPVIQSLHR